MELIRPNKEQYVETLAAGDDREDEKEVVLGLDGKFFINTRVGMIDNSDYVCRTMNLDANNRYVGSEFGDPNPDSDVVHWIYKSYAVFLNSWIKYKREGKCGQVFDTYWGGNTEEQKRKVAELESEIDNL